MKKLSKSKYIFHHVLGLYLRKKKNLDENTCLQIKETLSKLQQEIINKAPDKATPLAEKAEHLEKTYLKKTLWMRLCNSVAALLFALVAAIIIRSMWFEFYEIPTGSMRPTFQEKDRLAVSKTTFGINIPLMSKHFYFDPDLIKRGGIFIFSGANMDIADVNTRYFYLLPGKKLFVKRLIGKPGDILYFYGGQIYGVDANNKDISHEFQQKQLKQLDHVPYIHMNGKMVLSSPHQNGIAAKATLKQMNEEVATLSVSSLNKIEGKLLPPFAEKFNDYYDIWGFKNYGMGRLLTKEQTQRLTNTQPDQLEEAPLYLEIFHHPSVAHPKIVRGYNGKLHPAVGTNSTLLPLQEKHLKALFENMYTARFAIKNGTLYRFGSSVKVGDPCPYCPKLPSIPDGTYELYHGKGYQIQFGGIRKKLPADHPLLKYETSRVQFFYNLGIECNTLFTPTAKEQYLIPSRYLYFREGSLYTMGAPFITKDDPNLVAFIHKEHQKQEHAPPYQPYIPFEDTPPPLTIKGEIDSAFIQKNGIKIPPNHYLALGDNYAMSADSRDFGFVPEDNIRGAPSFIFWPPGNRFGPPLQVHYPFINGPSLFIWCSAIICVIIYSILRQRKNKLPIDIP